ncbi:hypothetical protein NM04_25500 [Massilia aurea]|uniref:DUF2721 domain-containing protein n=1 Tax=Massilia aurea TaxID=373040 RepID=A0A422QDV2_9BURK|nr:DUF2721 domain-containing protein [Massilia aurea]RNF28006.1 hypothetical protein NM04_25500 [Massilia aurea]
MNLQLSDIGEAIQLAIAPVFLLAGVGTMLIVLTNRLGRLIDRSRVLEDRLKVNPENECVGELLSLYYRARLINVGITASTACGLLICVVIAMLFLGDTTDLPLDQYIALCFVGGMLALIVAFVYLMREILICFSFMRAQQLKVLDGCGATAG